MAATRKQRSAANKRKKVVAAPEAKNINVTTKNTQDQHDTLLAESIGSRSMRQKKVAINAKMHIMTSIQWKDSFGKEFGQQPPKSVIEQPSVNGDHKDVLSVETGVEKHEEKEEHLKKILQNTNKTKHEYIPTPDASKVWAQYENVKIKPFDSPNHYIISTATLEDCYGIEYLMDEIDEEFLKQSKLDSKLSEDQFELICQIFEEIVSEHQPFLTVEPTSILDFDECSNIFQSRLKDHYPLIKSNLCSTTTNEEKGINVTLKKNLIQSLNIPKYIKLIWESDITNITLSHESENEIVKLWKQHGQQIYEHWKSRKLERHGDTIRPHLRFEKSGEKNDNDPYICFRRREIRQVRKTRKMDKINSQKLHILLEQLKRTKDIINDVTKREVIKHEALMSWEKIYQQRKHIRKEAIKLTPEQAKNIIIDEVNLNTQTKKKLYVNSTGETCDNLVGSVDFKLRKMLNIQLEEMNFVKENNIEELKVKIEKKQSQAQAMKKKAQQERAKKRQLKAEDEKQNKKRKTGKGNNIGSGSSFVIDKKSKVLKDLDPNSLGSGSLSQQQLLQQQRMKSSVYTEARNNTIPEHELRNVDTLLNAKQQQNKKFFEDAMQKRFLEDSNNKFVNFTNSTMNPSFDFNIPSGMLNEFGCPAISSSLSTTDFDIFNLSYNPIFDFTKDPKVGNAYNPDLSRYYNKEAIKGNVKVITTDGEIMESGSKARNDSSMTLFDNDLDEFLKENESKNIKVDNFDDYIMPETYQLDSEMKPSSFQEQPGRSGSFDKQYTKELPFLNRKRISRFNETFIDKQYNHMDQVENKHTDVLDEFFDFNEIEKQENAIVPVVNTDGGLQVNEVIDVYASKKDSYLRMVDRWKFDIDHYIHSPTLLESSSILNNISKETQVVRFSTMLGTKSYDKMKETQHQYRRDLVARVKKDQIKRQRFVEQMKKKQKQMLQLQMKQKAMQNQSGNASTPTNDNDTDEATNNNVKKKAKPTKKNNSEKQPTGSVNRTKKQETS